MSSRTPYSQWVFTNHSVRLLLRRAGFDLKEEVRLCEICPHKAECSDVGTEFLAVGRRF